MPVKPIGIALLLIVTVSAALVLGGCRHHRHAGHHDPHERAAWLTERISKELKLSEAQQRELESIRDEVLEHGREFRGWRGEMQQTLTTQLSRDQMDAAALNRLFEQKETEFRQMRIFMIDKLHQFHAMMTPEQRQQLAEKLQEFSEHHGRHRWN